MAAKGFCKFGVQGGVLISPMQWPALQCVDTDETPFLLPQHHAEQFWSLVHTQVHSSTQKISPALHKFQQFEDALGHLQQMYAPSHLSQSSHTLAVFSNLFPTSVIEHLHQ
jgi:hypothetical protein